MPAPETSDEFHQLTVPYLEPAAFFAQAKGFLAEYASEVIEDVIPRLTEWGEEARWHPLEFAVIPLKVLEDGSSVRLHAWVEGMRKGHSLKRPTIHDHAWHLTSRVLTPDPYQDTRYNIPMVRDVTMTEEERIIRGLHRVFRAHYPPEPQELRADGRYARVIPIRDEVVPFGQYNCIAAGEYHLDKIPIGHTVATLCLDSPRIITDGPHVIVDGPADAIAMARRPISPNDLRYLQAALQKVVA